MEEEQDGGEIWNENSISECLDGFVLIADADGTILYVTESVSVFLGLTQVMSFFKNSFLFIIFLFVDRSDWAILERFYPPERLR